MVNIFKFYNGKLEITASPKKEVTNESRESLHQFVDLFTKLFNSLDSSIGLDLFFKKNKSTLLAKKLNNLVDLWGAGDNKFHLAYGSLLMFADDLNIIKLSSPECFKKFKRELIKQRNSISWEGFRFEVRVYASLVKKIYKLKTKKVQISLYSIISNILLLKPQFHVLKNKKIKVIYIRFCQP